MYDILLRIHSLTPYLFLAITLVTLIMAGLEMPKQKCSLGLKAIARVTMILAHIQLLFGLMLLFFGDKARAAFTQGMSFIMKDAEVRMALVEHPLTMIIAVALFTIGFSRAKRADTNVRKTRNILIFYGIALALVLSRIPYASWFNL